MKGLANGLKMMCIVVIVLTVGLFAGLFEVIDVVADNINLISGCFWLIILSGLILLSKKGNKICNVSQSLLFLPSYIVFVSCIEHLNMFYMSSEYLHIILVVVCSIVAIFIVAFPSLAIIFFERTILRSKGGVSAFVNIILIGLSIYAMVSCFEIIG